MGDGNDGWTQSEDDNEAVYEYTCSACGFMEDAEGDCGCYDAEPVSIGYPVRYSLIREVSGG